MTDTDRNSLRRLQGMSVLLAEDNVTNQLVATQMLENLGATVDVASDGAIALERLAQDTELRLRMRDNARARSLDYSWKAILGRLVGDYYEAIDHYQPQAAGKGR